jgi:hypothetical protein
VLGTPATESSTPQSIQFRQRFVETISKRFRANASATRETLSELLGGHIKLSKRTMTRRGPWAA